MGTEPLRVLPPASVIGLRRQPEVVVLAQDRRANPCIKQLLGKGSRGLGLARTGLAGDRDEESPRSGVELRSDRRCDRRRNPAVVIVNDDDVALHEFLQDLVCRSIFPFRNHARRADLRVLAVTVPVMSREVGTR